MHCNRLLPQNGEGEQELYRQPTLDGERRCMTYLRTTAGSLQVSKAMTGNRPPAATTSLAASSSRTTRPRARMAPFLLAATCNRPSRCSRTLRCSWGATGAQQGCYRGATGVQQRYNRGAVSCDKTAIGMEERCDWGATGLRLGCDWGATRGQQGCNWGAAGVHQRCNRCATECIGPEAGVQ